MIVAGLLVLSISVASVILTPEGRMLPGYKRRILTMTALGILLDVGVHVLRSHSYQDHRVKLLSDVASLALGIGAWILYVRAGRLFCDAKGLDRKWAWMSFLLGPLGLTVIALKKGPGPTVLGCRKDHEHRLSVDESDAADSTAVPLPKSKEQQR